MNIQSWPSWEIWFYNWQTLIAGAFAIVAGGIALAGSLIHVGAMRSAERRTADAQVAGLVGLAEAAIKKIDEAVQAMESQDSEIIRGIEIGRLEELRNLLEAVELVKLPKPNLLLPFVDFKRNFLACFEYLKKVIALSNSTARKMYPTQAKPIDLGSLESSLEMTRSSCSRFIFLVRQR